MSLKRTKRSVKLLSDHPFLAFSFKSSSIECNKVNSSSQPIILSYKRSSLTSLTHPNYQDHLSLAPELMVQHATIFHRDCNHSHHQKCHLLPSLDHHHPPDHRRHCYFCFRRAWSNMYNPP